MTGPEIVETAARPAAVIHLTIRCDEMRSAMPAAIQEVAAALAERGLAPAGPLFAHHLAMPGERFEFEVGFPVDGVLPAVGRVKMSELPGGRIARATLQGDYTGLPDAWGEFGEWMKREGMEGRVDFWEIYAVGPESSPHPADWRTELCRPLR